MSEEGEASEAVEGPRIVVTGATGFTGRLVAAELAGAAGLPTAEPSPAAPPFLLTGRDPAKLERLAAELGGAPTRAVDVTRGEDVRGVARAGDVVINCAGPFSELGEPVVRACVEEGAHYLDITGEQAFMKRILDRYQAAARVGGVIVVNGAAFEYALGDCLVALGARDLKRPLRSVHVTYGWTGAPGATSAGTRRSVLHVMRSGGFARRGGRLVPERAGARVRRVCLPDGRVRAALSFPAGEVLTVPRHTEAGEVTGWLLMRAWRARLAWAASPALPLLARLGAPLLEARAARGREDSTDSRGPTDEERREGRFLILAELEDAGGERASLALRGRDPYGITAAVVVRAARRVLELTGRYRAPHSGVDAAGGEGGAPGAVGTPGGERAFAAGSVAPGDRRREPRPGAPAVPHGVLAPAQLFEPASFLESLEPLGVELERVLTAR